MVVVVVVCRVGEAAPPMKKGQVSVHQGQVEELFKVHTTATTDDNDDTNGLHNDNDSIHSTNNNHRNDNHRNDNDDGDASTSTVSSSLHASS